MRSRQRELRFQPSCKQQLCAVLLLVCLSASKSVVHWCNMNSFIQTQRSSTNKVLARSWYPSQVHSANSYWDHCYLNLHTPHNLQNFCACTSQFIIWETSSEQIVKISGATHSVCHIAFVHALDKVALKCLCHTATKCIEKTTTSIWQLCKYQDIGSHSTSKYSPGQEASNDGLRPVRQDICAKGKLDECLPCSLISFTIPSLIAFTMLSPAKGALTLKLATNIWMLQACKHAQQAQFHGVCSWPHVRLADRHLLEPHNSLLLKGIHAQHKLPKQ